MHFRFVTSSPLCVYYYHLTRTPGDAPVRSLIVIVKSITITLQQPPSFLLAKSTLWFFEKGFAPFFFLSISLPSEKRIWKKEREREKFRRFLFERIFAPFVLLCCLLEVDKRDPIVEREKKRIFKDQVNRPKGNCVTQEAANLLQRERKCFVSPCHTLFVRTAGRGTTTGPPSFLNGCARSAWTFLASKRVHARV